MLSLGSSIKGMTREVLIDQSTFLEGSQKFSKKERELINRIASAMYANPTLRDQTFKVNVDFSTRTFTLQTIHPKVANVCGFCPEVVKGDFLSIGINALSNKSEHFLIPSK